MFYQTSFIYKITNKTLVFPQRSMLNIGTGFILNRGFLVIFLNSLICTYAIRIKHLDLNFMIRNYELFI